MGIVEEDGYQVTTLERTLVDCLIYRHLVGLDVFLEALKKSMEKKKTTPLKVLDMAIMLKEDHHLRPYLEIFA